MRKTFPIFYLEQSPGTVLVSFCKNDSSYIIVTLRHNLITLCFEDSFFYETVTDEVIQSKKATAGAQWYNLPRTDLTPELKRDLQLLKMRNVLDPHRHYKKENGKLRPPEYSQVGTIVEGPTEYYSARLTNKDRKRTFVEEVLAGEQANGRFSKKYGDVQVNKTSGKKAYYKSVQDKRSKKR